MKKLLIVMSSLYNGGAERSLVNMLNEFPKDEYQIDLLLQKKEGMFLKQVPSQINVLQTPFYFKKLYGSLGDAKFLLFWKLFGNFISHMVSPRNKEKMRSFRWKYFYGPCIPKLEEHYDVAIAYISGEVLYYVSEKVSADRKLVWVHNDYKSAGYPHDDDYKHLGKMDAIISVSELCVNILKEEFPEFKSKIHLLENITSSSVVRGRAVEFVPKEFDKDSFNILSIGRLHEQKGFDIAIDTAVQLKKRGYKFLWHIIGTGEMEDALKKMIRDKDVFDCFKLLGAKENPYPYIQCCDLFVQTSRYEGKSVVLDEAKIIGVPIVATEYPTVHDQLKNTEGEIAGMDSISLANSIELMILNRERRQQYKDYLLSQEYGNQTEIAKYMAIINK